MGILSSLRTQLEITREVSQSSYELDKARLYLKGITNKVKAADKKVNDKKKEKEKVARVFEGINSKWQYQNQIPQATTPGGQSTTQPQGQISQQDFQTALENRNKILEEIEKLEAEAEQTAESLREEEMQAEENVTYASARYTVAKEMLEPQKQQTKELIGLLLKA